MASEKTTSNSIGFSGLLAIAFIVLKLCKVIAWSWLWVLAPLWIPVAVFLLLLMGYFISYISKKANSFEESTKTRSKWQDRYEAMMESQKKWMRGEEKKPTINDLSLQ